MMRRGDVEREIVFSREQSKAGDVPVMMIRASNYSDALWTLPDERGENNKSRNFYRDNSANSDPNNVYMLSRLDLRYP